MFCVVHRCGMTLLEGERSRPRECDAVADLPRVQTKRTELAG